MDMIQLESNQEIRGTFPEALQHLSNLKHVSLHHCNFQGMLPKWIGGATFPQLTALTLGDNKFQGSLPVGISQLSKLRFLALDNLQLTGPISLLQDLTQLQILYVAQNVLTGDFASSGRAWSKMVEMDLSDNSLDGTLPVDLFHIQYPNLVVVDLSRNQFHSNILDSSKDCLLGDGSVGNHSTLEFLSLHHNSLDGSLPNDGSLARLPRLRHLDLSFNKFTGTLPSSDLGMLTQLRYLSTSGNHFSNQTLLDLDLRSLTNLVDWSMKSNKLTGTIPRWIGDLSSLQLLDLDANDLTGKIPTTIGKLSNLYYLLLNRNRLTGSLPTQMAALSNLKVLLLDSNSITGTTNFLCQSETVNPEFFISDCGNTTANPNMEVTCRCCTTCCNDGDETCNNKAWTSTVDAEWEYGFARSSYQFDMSNAPVGIAKGTTHKNVTVTP
jgi:Leucine-rich repeat (LRR) protein